MNATRGNVRIVGWVCLVILSALGALVIFRRGPVRTKTNSNGTPEVLSALRANTNLRNPVLNTMGSVHMKADLDASAFPANATKSQASNVLETLDAMQGAGLLAPTLVTTFKSSTPFNFTNVHMFGAPLRLPLIFGTRAESQDLPGATDSAGWQSYVERMRFRSVATFDDVNPPLKIDPNSLIQ